MRPQPPFPIALRRAAEILEHAARETTDLVLASKVLRPAAAVLHRVAADFDAYVPSRLMEIDRLAALVAEAAAVSGPDEAARLASLIDAAREASGRLLASQLDDLVDALHRELIAVLQAIEPAMDQRRLALATAIWAEQRGVVTGSDA
jgi:hypothetical protein